MTLAISTARIALAAAVGLTAGAANSAELTSRYARIHACREVASSIEPDGILKRCLGYRGLPVWIAYTDSTKAHLGFGQRRNVSGIFATRGVETAMLEWRGSLAGKAFEPFAVIARLYRPIDNTAHGSLIIYRLQRDGTSCSIGAAGSNAKARDIADASLSVYRCEEPPILP